MVPLQNSVAVGEVFLAGPTAMVPAPIACRYVPVPPVTVKVNCTG